MSDFNVSHLIKRICSTPTQLNNHHKECYGGLALLGAHRNLLLYDESHVNSLPGHYHTKEGRWSFKVYYLCFRMYDVGLCFKVFRLMLLVSALGGLCA